MSQRLITIICATLCGVGLGLIGLDVLAQDPVLGMPGPIPGTSPVLPWQMLVGATINSVIILALVQAIKMYLPKVREAVPWALPIIAAAIGPAVAAGQTGLAGWLGVPIDLSPMLGLFTGASAVALHQIGKQTQNGG